MNIERPLMSELTAAADAQVEEDLLNSHATVKAAFLNAMMVAARELGKRDHLTIVDMRIYDYFVAHVFDNVLPAPVDTPLQYAPQTHRSQSSSGITMSELLKGIADLVNVDKLRRRSRGKPADEPVANVPAIANESAT